MANQQQQRPPSWYRQLQAWLHAVMQDVRVGFSVEAAVNRHRQQFPSQTVLRLLRQQVSQALAKQALRMLLRQAAKAAGLSVDASTLDLIASLAAELL